MSLKSYISGLVFRPPLPLLNYPLDLASDVELEESLVDDVCMNIYNEIKVPSICALYGGDGSLSRFNIVYVHGNNENLSTMRQ
jgi:hypothetical protein